MLKDDEKKLFVLEKPFIYMINEREQITGRDKRSGGMCRSDPGAESPLSCLCHRAHLSSPPTQKRSQGHNKGGYSIPLNTRPGHTFSTQRGGKRLFTVTNEL